MMKKYKNNDDPLCARDFSIGVLGALNYDANDSIIMKRKKKEKHNLESGDSLLKRITKFLMKFFI
jgi:hypothetical protein